MADAVDRMRPKELWGDPAAAALALDAATRHPPAAFPATLDVAACLALLQRCERLLRAEPTVLEIDPGGAEVVVVGDIHGQFHDLLTMFSTAGHPGPGRLFVFDGDLVDRGAWGLEVLLLVAAWKVAAPAHVFLVRGNHETTFCSWVYGFRNEVLAKYGAGREGQSAFAACQRLFAQLPLAAVVAGRALVVHGGLARAPPRRVTRRSLPEGKAQVTVASLAEMRASHKGGDDPEPQQADQRLPADVLWSDPGREPGVQLGARPGDVGIVFGPDVTEAFLRDNGLRLILRGHEGPDARALRPEMPAMDRGWTLDHDTPSGRLYTVFSAPNYPQFGAQCSNPAAVAVLSAPGYDQPRFVQYDAVPRPKATPFYSIETEDEEVAEQDGAGDVAAAGGVGGVPKERSQEGSSHEEEDGIGSKGGGQGGGEGSPGGLGEPHSSGDVGSNSVQEVQTGDGGGSSPATAPSSRRSEEVAQAGGGHGSLPAPLLDARVSGGSELAEQLGGAECGEEEEAEPPAKRQRQGDSPDGDAGGLPAESMPAVPGEVQPL
ncbi:hypothetical protein CHLNCDRAFT_140677 [Chlorella variabilis]|uniref:Serine/threonine-protein phosphatase n=1 Tax=Chlorella variabilis TaxID=554065 RepID=E1Z5Y4_CHLVA|nr:hypothetical protein CHLNCDRAFT_140677 [Chlorella variabilis]EFN58554.1 hypothetical protein CHLNCDRAFT_140677 [Chlorella variabilis]|eukprot:XP_005850656.1 hypothetical protein CHLNCDRAFT_140677 [Chlorella variabilis]